MWLDFVTERFLLNIILCGWILLQNAFFGTLFYVVGNRPVYSLCKE